MQVESPTAPPALPHLEALVSHLHRSCSTAAAASSSSATAADSNGAPPTYWPKGTGYGIDPNSYYDDYGESIPASGWDPSDWEQTQKGKIAEISADLESVSRALEVKTDLAEAEVGLVEEQLVPVLRSFLLNDSVEEVTKNPGIYKSALLITGQMADRPELRTSVAALAPPVGSLLRSIQLVLGFAKETDKDSLGIQEVNEIKDQALQLHNKLLSLGFVATSSADSTNSIQAAASVEDRYVRELSGLRFGEVSRFSRHHFGSQGAVNPQSPRKILFEMGGWAADALPISFSSSVFLRKDESDMTLLQAMITGPEDTPYSGGCFIFDIRLPANYPSSPPQVNLQTTGNGQVRFNPNLYNCGKVCLSLLGTWGGGAGEGWSAKTSTVLQLLVSIQSLIFVEHPYFNEPGYEAQIGSDSGDAESRSYNANIRVETIRHAMIGQLRNPPVEFAEVIKKHFALKRDSILATCDKWIQEAKEDGSAHPLEDEVSSLRTELNALA